MAVDLYLVLSGKKEHLSLTQIDVLKQAICKCINLKGLTIGHLPYISSSENDKNTTIARFQFPEHFPYEQISERLKSSAMKKEPWLRENGVIMLKVDGESSINIEENVEFNPPKNEDEFGLAKKPSLQAHKRDVVDVILVVEMPTSVTPSNCKTMLTECQLAADYMDLSKDNSIDINLAAVKFGNHSSSDQPIAFIVQDFCKEFKVYHKLKEGGQCGGGGNSGMADALAKVVELSEGDKIRPEASKVCVMISFLSKSSKHLEHYRCNHGNDVIKLTNTLEQREIPLYILGVHGNTQSAEEGPNVYFEECFLAGVCDIGGGRYFRVSKHEVTEVNKIISYVVVNYPSIEYHDVSDRQIVNEMKRLVKDPDIKPLHFQKLLQSGRSLEPNTQLQVAQRVALADDLTDAIREMELIKERKYYLPQRYHGMKSAQISYEKFPLEFDREMYCEEDVHADVMKSSHESPDTSTLEEDIPIAEPESKRLENPTDYTSRTIPLTIDQSGRYYDFSKEGFYLEIPPHTVSQTTEVVCKVSENYVPSPLGEFESLVSSVVQFEPTDMVLGKSINFTLMHSGLTIGHDTFVKAYDEDNHEWKRITEHEHRDHCVVVQMDKLTTIAVVTRVIIPVDIFEVPTSGCLIKSSVCPDVTICFPEASVDKAIKGRLKVIPMPKYFPVKVEEFPCPLLLVDGFKEIRFSEYVTIQMPHPCPERYPVGQVRLMCLEDDKWSENTDCFLCEEKESTIEIRVKHFSGLWGWLPGVPSSFRYIYDHLFLARQVMCFAAFKENNQLTLCPKITLMCADITKQKEIDEKIGCDYTRLALKTVKEGMRPNDTAYVKINGGFERNDVQQEDVYLDFIRDEISRDEVQIQRKADSTGNLIVSFYERNSNNTLLCKLHCNETIEAACQSITTASSEATPVVASSENVYKMKSSPRGLLVIINIDKFLDQNRPANRVGSDRDVDNLVNLFTRYLDFEVQILWDKSEKGLVERLYEICDNGDNAKYDCFACCIMSHGKDNSFFSADGCKIRFQKVISIFTNKTCWAFKGKPKIFIIQACRDEGSVDTSNDDTSETGSAAQRVDTNNPDMYDILKVYACYRGFSSFRAKKGTIFIQSLVTVFREHANEEHIADLFTKVIDEVHRILPEEGGDTQVPVIENTLKQKLYLRPPHHNS